MRRVTLLLLAFLLTGCAAGVKLSYSRLDWLITSWAGSYVDLNPVQKEMLRGSARDIIAWHCRTQLPRYTQWLGSIDAQLIGVVSPRELEPWYREIDAAWQDLMDLAAPALAQVGATLSTAQVAQLLGRIDKNNRKYYRETVEVAPGRLRKEYAARMTDELERWIGRLTVGQRLRVARWAEEVDLLQAERRRQRELWRADLATALALRQQRHEFEPRLRELLVGRTRRSDTAFERRYVANTQRALALIAAVRGELTPAQRNHASRQLVHYASVFSSVRCTAPAPAAQTAATAR